jgi:hypothetical protein
MSRLSGRSVSRFFALGFVAVLLGVAAPASAKPGFTDAEAARAKPARVHPKRASLTASEQDFKLFGTSFCVPSSVPDTGCDVAVPEGAVAMATPRAEHPPRVDILGVSLCSAAEETGPACDVVWQDPQPAQTWRDAPEIRTADVMPRRR